MTNDNATENSPRIRFDKARITESFSKGFDQANATELLRSQNAHLNPSDNLFCLTIQSSAPAIYLTQQNNATSNLTISFGVSGGILFAENGYLKYRGQSGTITTLAVA